MRLRLLLARILLRRLWKPALKLPCFFYFNLDWNFNIANSAKRTMREHTISNLLSSTTIPPVCWASLMLNCCMLRVYGRISCCISVISSPLQVYRRRAADINPSLTVQWSKSCSKKEWNFDIKRVDQGKINNLRRLRLQRRSNARNVSFVM